MIIPISGRDINKYNNNFEFLKILLPTSNRWDYFHWIKLIYCIIFKEG